MGNKSFNLKIVSSDGKIFQITANAIYVNVKDYGVMGFLVNNLPTIASIDISSFKIIDEFQKVHIFATSGGVISFNRKECNMLLDTFEEDSELDKTRILEHKERAEKRLSELTKDDRVDYEKAQFSLKKALNRLSLLK